MRIALVCAISVVFSVVEFGQAYAWTYADATSSDDSSTVYVWSLTDGSHGGSNFSHTYAAYLQVQAPSGQVILNAGGWAPTNEGARADGQFEATDFGEYYATASHQAICSIEGQFLYAPSWFPRITVGQGYTSWSVNNPYPAIYTKDCDGLEAGTCGPNSIPTSPFLPYPVFWREYSSVKIGSIRFCRELYQNPGWVGCFIYQ